MSNFKINSFGTPNGLSPNTIQNTQNNNTYIINFGGTLMTYPVLDSYLYANGNSDILINPVNLSTDKRFYMGKNGYIKKIVINMEGYSYNNFDFKISINGVDKISIPIPLNITTVFPLIIDANCSVLEGQYIQVHNVFNIQNIYKMFVSLYIE